MNGILKKVVAFIAAVLLMIFCSFSASANDNQNFEDELIAELYEETGADELIFQVPENAREFLEKINISDSSPLSADDLSFNTIINTLAEMLRNIILEPLRIMVTVIGIILITAMFDTLKNGTLSTSLEAALTVVTSLCMISVMAVPMLSIVTELSDTIINASNFMIVYVPVVSVLIASSGQPISAGAFYATMIYISNAIAQISSRLIIPILKSILSLSIVASVSDKVSLDGFINLFKKAVKLILCFCMSLFVAFITMKSIITTAEDSISNKVVKFAINSFVPLVGGALSDAYQTVISCVTLLKSSVGVVAMFAVFAIFLPAILRCFTWQLALTVSGAVCEVFGVKKAGVMLSSLNAVLSVICAILLSIMVIYIISTAIILIVGG